MAWLPSDRKLRKIHQVPAFRRGILIERSLSWRGSFRRIIGCCYRKTAWMSALMVYLWTVASSSAAELLSTADEKNKFFCAFPINYPGIRNVNGRVFFSVTTMKFTMAAISRYLSTQIPGHRSNQSTTNMLMPTCALTSANEIKHLHNQWQSTIWNLRVVVAAEWNRQNIPESLIRVIIILFTHDYILFSTQSIYSRWL